MAKLTMGEMISALRREKGWTQKNIADELGITDKAVSKWERNLALPDIATIPKLAELLDVSVEELMQAKAIPGPVAKETARIVDFVLKSIPLAMGVAVMVTAILGELDLKAGFIMVGLGMASIGVYLLKENG